MVDHGGGGGGGAWGPLWAHGLLLIVGNRKTVVGRREVCENVQKPGYDRRGLWRSCVVFSSATIVRCIGGSTSLHWTLSFIG